MLNPKASLWLLTVATAGLLGLALFFVLHGVLNADEGFYLAASQLVSEGFRPYRDFGYTQGPVLPYVNLPWLALFGHTLMGLRLTCLTWTVLTVGLGIQSLKRAGTGKASVIFVVLLLGSPLWLAFAVKGKTYAFAALMVLIGTMAMTAKGLIWVRWLVFGTAAALGIGARLPMAGFFVPGGIILLVLTPGLRMKLTILGITLASAAVVIWTAPAGAWDNLYFWTLGFHRASTFRIDLIDHYVDSFRFAPGLWVFVFLSLGIFWKTRRFLPLLVIGPLLMGVVLNLSASTTYAEYIFPLIPALAWVVAPQAADQLSRMRSSSVAVTIALVSIAGWNYPPEYSRNLLVHAGQAEAFLRTHVPAGSTVVASMPEIAVAAGTRIPLTLAMGKFGVTEDFDEVQAQRRMMLTPDKLQELLRSPDTKALVASPSYNWNFFWSLPSYRPLSRGEQHKIHATIHRHFVLSFLNEEYVVFLRRPDESLSGPGPSHFEGVASP